MIDLHSTLFQFLNLGLWKETPLDDGVVLTNSDWDSLFEIAHSQAVTGIFIDGVSRSSQRPPDEKWNQWILYQLFLEHSNRSLLSLSEQWQTFLSNHSISASLFKGPSVSSWYLNPMHRSVGDVDLVITEGWDMLKELLLTEHIPFKVESGDFVIVDRLYTVELHRRWEFFYNPILNDRLQSMLNNQRKLSNELYFACLVIHLRRHFLTYGVGLKQIVDIAVMLHYANLDMSFTASLLKYFHIERFSRYLFGFIKSNFYIVQNFPLSPIVYGKNFYLIEKVVWEDGFELKIRQDKKSKSIKNEGVRVLNNFVFWCARSYGLLRLMPFEIMAFLSYKFYSRLKLIFRF